MPGKWRVNVLDLSSNDTVETTFEVISFSERIEALEGQLSSLQRQINTLNNTIEALEASVKDLSYNQAAIETSSLINYGAIAISAMLLGLSIMITKYL